MPVDASYSAGVRCDGDAMRAQKQPQQQQRHPNIQALLVWWIPLILQLTFCRKTLINTKFVSFIGPMKIKRKGVTYIASSQNPMSLSNGSAVWSILAQFNSFNDLSTFLALNWFYSIIALYSLFCTSYQPETVACMHKELINKTSNNTISTFL